MQFFWKTTPFIRLLLPLSIGIILQWYVTLPISVIVFALMCIVILLIGQSFISISKKIALLTLQGVLLQLLFFFFGCFVTWNKDVRHDNNWYGHYYHDSDLLVVRIDEPPIEKTKSYKADAFVEQVIHNDSIINCGGKLLLYFSKDSATAKLHYGDKIIINKTLQIVKNNGNPGAFNYSRYAAFQQTFHNLFLNEKDWVSTNQHQTNWFKKMVFKSQQKILATLKKNISGNKDETGIAEALLIGYKEDLDKDLVQAYSNTGVVHIIAISGLHLGLIYVMLVWLFAKIPFLKRTKLLNVILILTCLWLFSIITGASASVLRSAVMFTCIAIGKNFFRQASVYNSLAASAFIMLCYNPYFLWDVGFQLSYLAVIGIVLFEKPIYSWIYIKNKWLDKVWKLISVSLAAQLLTFPICIYYFHQFPNLFLITNIIAVPLSSIILFAEIILICLAWIPFVGEWLGKLTNWLVWIMNKIVLWINDLPFALWDKIAANSFTTSFLYAVVIGFAFWLMNKSKIALKISLIALLFFTALHSYNKWQIKNQQKLIVYNVPQKSAVDFVKGNNYVFKGDSVLLEDGMLQNFHLKPSRVALQLNQRTDTLNNLKNQNNFYQFNNKRILFLDEEIVFDSLAQKINVDIIIISKNPKLYIPQLASVLNCKQYIFDASNPMWKIEKWKQDCNKLNLQYHSIPEQGAFVLDVSQ